MAKAPKPGMSTEELLALQQERAQEFGIEALAAPPARLQIPKGFPRKWSDYGDPVNIAYPLAPEARLKSARARFKASADRYEQESSKRIIHNRIVARMLRDGLKVSYNEDDALDQLLSPAIKRRLTKKSFEGHLDLELRVCANSFVEQKAFESLPGELIVEAYAAASNLDLTQFGKGPGDIIAASALQDIADWVVARYKTVLFNHIDDRPIGRVLEAEVVNTDDGAKLRVVFTISGSEPDIAAKVRDGTLQKLSIRFIPLEIKPEKDPQTGKTVRVILRAVGLEISVVSIPMNWAAEILEVSASKSAGRDVRRYAFSVVAPVEWREGGHFAAELSLGDDAPDGLDLFLRALHSAGVSRDDAAGTGAVLRAATLTEGLLRVEGQLLDGDPAELRSLLLQGVAARAVDDAAVLGLGLTAVELSASQDTHEFSLHEEITMGTEKKSLADLLAELRSSTDAERVDELRGLIDTEFLAIDAKGAPLPHPLSAGDAAKAFADRLAEAKSAADTHMASLYYAIDTMDWLATSTYSALDESMKSGLAQCVESVRACAKGDSAPTPAEGKFATNDALAAHSKSVTDTIDTLKAANADELKAMRLELSEKAATALAATEKATALEKALADLTAATAEAATAAQKAAGAREGALRKSVDELTARADDVAKRLSGIEKRVGGPSANFLPPAGRTYTAGAEAPEPPAANIIGSVAERMA